MSREVMKQALEALDLACNHYGTVGGKDTHWGRWDVAASALRAELAKPEPGRREQRMCPNTYYECGRGCGDEPCKAFYDAYDIKEKS